MFDVLVNTEDRDIGGVAGDIQGRLKNLQQAVWTKEAKRGVKTPAVLDNQGLIFPDGMRINLRGEYSRMIESFGSLGFGLAMASVLVYLLLVVLFRSFLSPLIIMFAVPLGLIGVLTMLFITHTTLNVQSSMGVIFMVGIVVANGVLLVDFANKQRRLGASVQKADHDGGQHPLSADHHDVPGDVSRSWCRWRLGWAGEAKPMCRWLGRSSAAC